MEKQPRNKTQKTTASSQNSFDGYWNQLEKTHGLKMTKTLGEGSFGQVYEAQCLQSQQKFAIKLLKEPFRNTQTALQTLREIKVLRKLSQVEDNIFTTKLVDIILPPEVHQTCNNDLKEDEKEKDLSKFTHVFLVMELG